MLTERTQHMGGVHFIIQIPACKVLSGFFQLLQLGRNRTECEQQNGVQNQRDARPCQVEQGYGKPCRGNLPDHWQSGDHVKECAA